MGYIRSFTGDAVPNERTLEDAPDPMRQELVDLFFNIAEHNQDEVSPEHVYRAASQSLGIQTSGTPYSGYRYALGRDIRKVEWPRIYDLIGRLYADFARQGFAGEFLVGVNRILAAYFTAWELDEEGRLYRVLPLAAHEQVKAVFDELQQERYAAALDLFKAGRNAYDERPERRDRDACSNIFDAMESVAKEKFQMPHATFGQVVTQIPSPPMNQQIKNLLIGLNELRNKNFGHGMTTQFSLSREEVDFAYLSLVGSILMFTRMR